MGIAPNLVAVMLNLFQHPSRGEVGGWGRAMDRQPCVYILASAYYGTLYIGVTSDLVVRLHQHRSGAVPGFTAKYGVDRLVRVEMFEDMPNAIAREKQLKRWHRDWKINLIETDNPRWDDLAIGLGMEPTPAPASRDGP